MTSLFVALTLYPEVQKRAQAQINSVISRDRLPTFEDRSRLPYIEAICKELLRWQILLPLGTSFSSWCKSMYLNNSGRFPPCVNRRLCLPRVLYSKRFVVSNDLGVCGSLLMVYLIGSITLTNSWCVTGAGTLDSTLR